MTAVDADRLRAAANGCRFDPAATTGHYESWFQRANHPARPLAFWIRYTIYRPASAPSRSVGELWAIWFDGERGRTVAVKQVVPIADCGFSSGALDVAIGAATLDATRAAGDASSPAHRIAWRLAYESPSPPLFLLPRGLYDAKLPRAKALTGSPNAKFCGWLEIDGEAVAIEAWAGSQNHNWGSRHTDSYAWGQVAGFDDAPEVFVECSTAQLRFGPIWTPRMSLVVLRVGEEEFALNRLATSLGARGTFDFFDWRIETAQDGVRAALHVAAPRSAFVGLAYGNPPGGTKTCLNTKLAACTLDFERSGRRHRWTTRHRAAFEILTDRSDHGVEIVA